MSPLSSSLGVPSRKSLFAALAAGFVVLASAVACGGSDPDTPAADNTDQDQTEPINIAFIYSSPHNDGGWSEAHDQGRLAVEEAFPGQVTTTYKENVPGGPEGAQIIEGIIQDGANVIFATSFDYHGHIAKAAKNNPDITFFQIQSTEVGPNLSEYTAALEEASYLAGMAAGGLSETGQMGISAAFPIPVINNYVNAFALGAKETNPDATVRVVWTNSWYDPAKEATAARTLVDAGSEALAAQLNSPAFVEVAQKTDVPAFGSFWHQSKFAPEAVVTSTLYNWGLYYVEQVGQILDGTWESSNQYLTMESGVPSLDEFGPKYELLSQDVKDLVAERQAELEAGTFSVYTGPITDNQGTIRVNQGETLDGFDRLSVDWYVENVLNPS